RQRLMRTLQRPLRRVPTTITRRRDPATFSCRSERPVFASIVRLPSPAARPDGGRRERGLCRGGYACRFTRLSARAGGGSFRCERLQEGTAQRCTVSRRAHVCRAGSAGRGTASALSTTAILAV